METFANYLIKELNFELPTGSCLQDISKQSHRYLSKTLESKGLKRRPTEGPCTGEVIL